MTDLLVRGVVFYALLFCVVPAQSQHEHHPPQEQQKPREEQKPPQEGAPEAEPRHQHSGGHHAPAGKSAAQDTSGADAYVPGPRRQVPSTGTTVTYHLRVSDTTVNFAGRKMPALATNGRIPAPVLNFTEGDTADLYVHNDTKHTVSFHWHGILLPNRFDGVPMLTTEVIHPGDTYRFKFKIIQHGTYWYHSHTGLDEQRGQYGPIVIRPQGGIPVKEKVIHLSDWVNERPWEVLRTLKRHNDWYAIRRNAIQTYGRAMAKGALGTKLWLEWKRMPDMDLADVYYQTFLANGRAAEQAEGFEPGDRVRLRIVNGSASSNFWLQFAGGKMRVVAADGLDVTPVDVDKVFIATAETYDVEITIPAEGSHELRASSWDASGFASVWFGEGKRTRAPDLPQPDYFALAEEMREMMKMMPGMKMGKAPANIPETSVGAGGAPEEHAHDAKPTTGKGQHGHQTPEQKETHKGRVLDAAAMEHNGMAMHEMARGPLGTSMTGYSQVQAAFPGETLLHYDTLRAPQPTTLPAGNPVRTVHLFLTGNMFRYVWSVNNLPLSRADRILIRKGENVRFVLHNTTMMSHPMHLHGHFFRVVNNQGAHAPLKHTVNIAPMENVTIEFEATEEKDWFFHCHLLYHMMSGMGRVVRYEGSPGPLDTRKKFAKFNSDDRALFPFGEVSVQSNGIWGEAAVRNTYWQLGTRGEANWSNEFDVEPQLHRFIGPKQFFSVFAGAEFSRHQEESEAGNIVSDRRVATAGFRYFLPMHFWADVQVDHEGRVQLELEREEIPITQRLRVGGALEYAFSEGARTSGKALEYRLTGYYIFSKYAALSVNYHSEWGVGGGLRFIY